MALGLLERVLGRAAGVDARPGDGADVAAGLDKDHVGVGIRGVAAAGLHAGDLRLERRLQPQAREARAGLLGDVGDAIALLGLGRYAVEDDAVAASGSDIDSRATVGARPRASVDLPVPERPPTAISGGHAGGR